MKKNDNNVVQYKKPFSINLGFILFLMIIIYVIFNFVLYFTKKNVAEYEVGQGSIAANNVYQGLAVRDETVFYADRDGYINYYIANCSKVSVLDMVYSIDSNGDIYKAMDTQKNKETALSSADYKSLSDSITSFMSGYSSLNFNEATIYRDDLSSDIIQAVNNQMMVQLAKEIDDATQNHTFFKGYPEHPGLVLYYVDQYESYKPSADIGSDDLNGVNYSKDNLNLQSKVKKGDPIYKLVNSEEWHIYLDVSSDVVDLLSESNYVKIRFCEDDYTLTVPFSVNKKDGHYIMDLKLKKALIRYAGERFLDVELIMNEDSGLKIPNSAIVEKDFYKIPVEYFAKGGDSGDLGILLDDQDHETRTYTFVAPTIYAQSDDEKYYYVDSEEVSRGDKIQKPGSTESYEVSETGSLMGVYNINKGYAIFKQIRIIYQNEEYAIVEPRTTYGIALYDHIALDASSLSENELVIK